MSRYVNIDLGLCDRSELEAGLSELGVPVDVAPAGDRLMLAGSLECTGEPADIRIAAGTHDAVEDFGFVCEDDRIRLVCGEYDRNLLESSLLAPLQALIATRRARQAAEAAGMTVEETVEADGRRRLLLQRK